MGKILAATAATATLAATVLIVKKREKLDLEKVDYLHEEARKTKKIVDLRYADAVHKSIKDLKRRKNELGLPGVVIAVSVDGEMVWAQGFGMANVETETPCTVNTKMRIASISKPITTSLLAQLKESGLVDLDKQIQEYVPYFPTKVFSNKAVPITTRLLACHMAGIRHYKTDSDSDGDDPEFLLKERFKTVADSVALFSQDDLLSSPGEKYKYTTHGYTLLSAVIEGAAKEPFDKLMRRHLITLGLCNTHLDEISPLLYSRASYYRRDKDGNLVNAELADNSYKWAGGGLVSDVGDLLKFANIMLYSYQQDGRGRAGFLTSATVKELWTPVPGTRNSWSPKAKYGLGWTVVPREEGWIRGQLRQRFHVGHSGGAVGASSVLVIFPLPEQRGADGTPSGVAVAIITNLQKAGLYRVAKQIAERFIVARNESVNTS